MRKQKLLQAQLALVIASIFWGFNAPLIKLGLESVPPAIFIVVKFLTASLFFLPFAQRTWRRLRHREYLLLILSSIFAISLSALLLNLGLQRTTATNAAILSLLDPLLLFVLSVAVLKERLSLKTLIGIIVALIGSFIIIGKPWEGNDDSMLIGNLYVVLSGVAGIIGLLISKPLASKTSAFQLTFMNLFPGTVLVAIYSLSELPQWDITGVTIRSFIGVIGSTLAIICANLCFYYALRYKKAQDTGVYEYLRVAVAIIAAWIILAEAPTTVFLVGATFVVLGVYIVESGAKMQISRPLVKKQLRFSKR